MSESNSRLGTNRNRIRELIPVQSRRPIFIIFLSYVLE